MRRVRLTDPETSRMAAQSVSNLRESQTIILDALNHFFVMTDEEIYEFISAFHQISVSGCRTRRKELCDMGYVADSGLRGTTKSGRKTIKWEITDEGEERLHDAGHEGRAAEHERRARQRPEVEASEDGDVHPPPDSGPRQRRIRLR